MVISMLKIRRPLGRLIFNMGIAIPGKTVFLIETAPSTLLIESMVFVILSAVVLSCFGSVLKMSCSRTFVSS